MLTVRPLLFLKLRSILAADCKARMGLDQGRQQATKQEYRAFSESTNVDPR